LDCISGRVKHITIYQLEVQKGLIDDIVLSLRRCLFSLNQWSEGTKCFDLKLASQTNCLAWKKKIEFPACFSDKQLLNFACPKQIIVCFYYNLVPVNQYLCVLKKLLFTVCTYLPSRNKPCNPFNINLKFIRVN